MTEPMMASEKYDRISRYQAACRKGADWLLKQMNEDGSIGDPRQGYHFYRAPWAFTVLGETAAAGAICGWIRRHMLTPAGTIEGPFRIFQDAYAYRNSALIVGAHMALQYDLSHGLMSDLLSWQDQASGGFSNDRLPDGGQSDDMDIPYACGPGFACLATGRLDAARAVYRFLKTIYAAQTELPERFFYTWSRRRQAPVTEFPAQRALWYVVENQVDREQRWTIGGIAAGFLCRLHLAEPRPEYLALARQYQAFSMGATEQQFKYGQVCKSSWGSSLLYQITGEEQYLQWTYRLGDWYLATQRDDGWWGWDRHKTLGARIEVTLEFVLHLDTLVGGLASRA